MLSRAGLAMGKCLSPSGGGRGTKRQRQKDSYHYATQGTLSTQGYHATAPLRKSKGHGHSHLQPANLHYDYPLGYSDPEAPPVFWPMKPSLSQPHMYPGKKEKHMHPGVSPQGPATVPYPLLLSNGPSPDAAHTPDRYPHQHPGIIQPRSAARASSAGRGGRLSYKEEHKGNRQHLESMRQARSLSPHAEGNLSHRSHPIMQSSAVLQQCLPSRQSRWPEVLEQRSQRTKDVQHLHTSTSSGRHAMENNGSGAKRRGLGGSFREVSEVGLHARDSSKGMQQHGQTGIMMHNQGSLTLDNPRGQSTHTEACNPGSQQARALHSADPSNTYRGSASVSSSIAKVAAWQCHGSAQAQEGLRHPSPLSRVAPARIPSAGSSDFHDSKAKRPRVELTGGDSYNMPSGRSHAPHACHSSKRKQLEGPGRSVRRGPSCTGRGTGHSPGSSPEDSELDLQCSHHGRQQQPQQQQWPGVHRNPLFDGA
ncbi:hypothetical protein DUNSADRAFT_1239 [Dunaliella salina]|uniref:Encoded protein n=1 Tax=Dunaliella salina TaxID=3046 RepID=A0ABQ7FXT1_DUNSA|nr:hypothetical protein DUNSADRAFT_1239 [Dunaliella salina]|eukprot:KAF5827156.1 hypothetical protein DUNSADRAFT_1239 [Dunaliella salina]